MGGARYWSAWSGATLCATLLGCATGETLGGALDDVGAGGSTQGTGGSDAGAMPMPTSTATATAPTSSVPPIPSAPPDDGGSTSEEGGTGPVIPPCPQEGLKRCAGICVNPSPSIGCALDDCTPCPIDDNGETTCDGETCLLTCNDGYELASGQCFAPEECTDGELNNDETDLDCGGDLCPPCPPGDACVDDDDCARGPCESGTCGCTGLTCEDVAGCGASVDDGCGNALDCSGTCQGNDVCFQATCCTPITTCSAGLCGPSDDGCGGTVDCGTCSDGICLDGQCCVARTAADCGGSECGTVSDGCGGQVDCGNPCGDNPCIDGACCTPSSCTMSGCGFQSDGCGGNACSTCANGSRCNEDRDCTSGNCDFVLLFGCGIIASNCCVN